LLTNSLARYPLAVLPTPLQPLPRLSEILGAPSEGPQIWIKRDDMTGLATGGNKARKLEFLVADALAQGATTLITAGAPQSNHSRQTAAAAAKCGLRCVLVLGGGPPTQSRTGGNVLIDRLVGAEIRWTEAGQREETMAAVAEEERGSGRVPYIIPYGGSNAMGAAGYVAALEELQTQMIDSSVHLDYVVFATSSGGTQAGLCVAAKALDFSGQIVGISVDEEATALQKRLTGLAADTAAQLGLDLTFSEDEFLVNDAYLGGGYGVLGNKEREAIQLLAETEGVLIDPVYTARAMAGLLGLVEQGAFDSGDNVCFWHTGGTPGIFAYGEALLEQSEEDDIP